MKDLLRRKSILKNEAETILMSAHSEVRGLNEAEDTKYNEIMAEITEINSKIEAQEAELRSNTVEVVDNKAQEKGEDKMNKRDMELRGMADFIQGVDSEEVRDMTTSNGAGIVPEVLDTEVIKSLAEVAPLFDEVPKFTPEAGTISIPVEENIGTAGFVGEAEAVAKSDFTVKNIELTQKRAGSEIVLSQHLINDSGIDVVAYAQELLFRRLGLALDRAMIIGTDEDKSIQGLNKITAKPAAPLTIEALSGAMLSVNPELLGGAKWIMARDMFVKVGQMKDETGNLYLCREVVNGKIVYKLFGLPVAINDAVAKDEIFLANIKEAYRGMVKKGTQLSKISEDTVNRRNGTVTLVIDTYVDAKIVRPEAIVRLKISAAAKSK